LHADEGKRVQKEEYGTKGTTSKAQSRNRLDFNYEPWGRRLITPKYADHHFRERAKGRS